MKIEENKAIMRRFAEEVQCQHNLSVLNELFSQRMVDHSGIANPPTLEGTRQLMAMMFAAFPDFTATIHDQIAEGDKVVTRKTFTGTHCGDYLGLPPTDKEISFQVIEIVRLKGGKVIDHWAVGDMLSMLQQLGMVPQLA